MPLLSGRQVIAALKRLGFVEIHRKGSHVKKVHPDGRRVVFPFHDEIDPRFALLSETGTSISMIFSTR